MDKLNNCNTCMSTDFIPSYEELASFSGRDIDKFVQEGLNCNCDCNSGDKLDSYNLRIKLFGNDNCNNGALNSLVLDNVGNKYSYVDGTASIDDNCFDPDFNVDGVSTEIFSCDENRLLKLNLVEGGCNNNSNEDCFINAGNGFRISQVIRNIDNFDNLIRTSCDSRGSVCINQRVYLLNRCRRSYVIFNFNLSNNGNGIAQKILFKDVFPENILINERSIFLDGCRLGNDKIFLNRNRVVVKLPDLDAGKEMNLMIVGILCNHIRRNNFATISYVSSCTRNGNRTNVNISQKISNVKSI